MADKVSPHTMVLKGSELILSLLTVAANTKPVTDGPASHRLLMTRWGPSTDQLWSIQKKFYEATDPTFPHDAEHKCLRGG